MSYRAGTIGLARIGIPDDVAHLLCDGCGARRTVTKPSGMPYSWLLDDKAAPGWAKKKVDGMRRDYCQTCKAVGG